MVFFVCCPCRAFGQSLSIVESQDDELTIDEPYRVSIRGWIIKGGKQNRSKHNYDPPAVFNVLDTVLVNTMERLKKLRLINIWFNIIIMSI